jgi:hypothetical protein
MLVPLTDLVGECGETKSTRMNKTKIKSWWWDPKPFEIYTDASSTQLGAVITQDNRPIAFFSRKLFEMQQKYSVTETELLTIVETLKEFKGMLWGQDIKVYTDHKKSHKRCPRTHLWQSVPLAVTLGGICPWNNIYKGDS